MKKIIVLIIAFAMLSTLYACGNDGTDMNNSTLNLEEKYSGYYADFEEGIISVINYDPNDMSSIPTYQELISYGEGAGLENKGTVYYIYVFDSLNSNKSNERYYYAELADETMEVLIEEDKYFENEIDRKKVVDKLIEIMNYVRNDINE